MKKSSIDKEVIERIRGTLDKAANADYSSFDLPARKAYSPWAIARWSLAVIIMVASLSVYWSLQKLVVTSPQVNIYSVENLVTHEAQAWQEDAGLLEEIEFYAWLAMQNPELSKTESAMGAK